MTSQLLKLQMLVFAHWERSTILVSMHQLAFLIFLKTPHKCANMCVYVKMEAIVQNQPSLRIDNKAFILKERKLKLNVQWKNWLRIFQRYKWCICKNIEKG